MNEDTLHSSKALLEEKRGLLEQELASFAKKDPKVAGDWDTKYPRIPEGGMEGAADEVEEYTNRLHVEFSLENQLKKVQEALECIEKGTYGTCAECGKEIDENRLRAYPEARNCKKCS
ncbi:TraR/DksA C4-type zinc finger protein [Patescibacteria group bacterium]|nr:TraR/DksA C4-type zinc finger protein [Patescibacteria group bacterium]